VTTEQLEADREAHREADRNHGAEAEVVDRGGGVVGERGDAETPRPRRVGRLAVASIVHRDHAATLAQQRHDAFEGPAGAAEAVEDEDRGRRCVPRSVDENPQRRAIVAAEA